MLYFGGIVLLFTLAGFFYYQKESNRIERELAVALKLHAQQCKRLSAFAPPDFKCSLPTPEHSDATGQLQRELFFAAVLVSFAGMLISFILARLALRPMHDAFELVDSFVDAMIHDLNTPIASASLNIDALAKELDGERQQKRLRRVSQSLMQLRSLQHQLRSAISHSALQYEQSIFELCSVLHEAAEISELVNVECDAPMLISADRTMVARMVGNLLDNAVKYNRDANAVSVTLEAGVMQIRDRGHGIRNVERVFERYYRERSSMSGLGIGLGIVKTVCTQYALPLQLNSRVGEGTTVVIDFNGLRTEAKR